MTIDRQKGHIVVMCDGEDCIESINTETDDWLDAQQVLRRERWRASKATGEWKNYCPGCAAEIMGEGA
jgi:uncharacterized protein YqgQ